MTVHCGNLLELLFNVASKVMMVFDLLGTMGEYIPCYGSPSMGVQLSREAASKLLSSCCGQKMAVTIPHCLWKRKRRARNAEA